MCPKCVEIDKRINRLNYLYGRLGDRQTLEGIVALKAELEAQKKALHPDQPDK